jgi:putative oxidoreductase
MNTIHNILVAIGTKLQCLLLLVIRLYFGWQIMHIGWGKLTHLDATTKYFATLPYVGHAPEFNVILAGLAETVGGILLLLGLWSRFGALALVFTMLVAYVTAEPAALHAFFSNPDKFTGADPFLFFAAALLVFCFGPGKIAIDSLIFKNSASGK